MKFKTILPLLLLLVVQACQKGKSPGQKTEQVHESETHASKDVALENKSPGGTDVSELAQSIIADEWEYQGEDESPILSMFDSLEVASADKKNFWFLAISKVLPQSDGALSEVLGVAVYRYVEEKPTEFFTLLKSSEATISASKNLKNWADMIWGEIQIEYEREEKAAVEKYLQAIKAKCSKISGTEKKLLDEFIQGMQD